MIGPSPPTSFVRRLAPPMIPGLAVLGSRLAIGSLVSSNSRPRIRRRPPDFAPSFETPGGYVGQAVIEKPKTGREELLLIRGSST
jgi:hypothetical protein